MVKYIIILRKINGVDITGVDEMRVDEKRVDEPSSRRNKSRRTRYTWQSSLLNVNGGVCLLAKWKSQMIFVAAKD